ncbi:hypothetical protein CDAR_220502 [Caerostris darwini]|uniref:Uncharacterized protein n=1 Tax=Caerostris darwini TaxID=1538125 RepID=A0AAV4UFN5_9ARAC|nr:hypothetical protein CDAR_220502 [Caerostris darwini]
MNMSRLWKILGNDNGRATSGFNLKFRSRKKEDLGDSEEQPSPNLSWICPDCATFSILIIGEPPAGSIWQKDAFWIDSNTRFDICKACSAVSFKDLPLVFMSDDDSSNHQNIHSETSEH